MANVIIFADNSFFTETGKTPGSSMRSPGVYRIATEVRKTGVTCQVIEMMTEFSLEELDEVCKKFITDETLIVGFSTTFWLFNHQDLTNRINLIIKFSKSVNLNIKIIFGGTNGLNLIQYYPDVDTIFLGYAEHYFIKYLDHIIKKKPLPFPNKTIGKTKIYEFVEYSDVFQFCNSQTVYDKSDCLISGEPVMFEIGRGCIFKCKFCAYPLTGKKKLDHLKDPEVIKEELIRNYEEYKIDKYIISDDTFNDSNEKLEYLHKIFTSLPFKIRFASYLRLDLLNAHRHQIELLEEMGLVGVNFGIESFHEKAARTIGKGIIPEIAKQFLYDLKSKYWLDRVKIQIGLIAGLPHETLESYDETERWILDQDNCLIESVALSPLSLRNPNVFQYAWMSEFEKNSEKYGFYWKDDTRFWYNDTNPVNSFVHAVSIYKRLGRAVTNSSRNMQGGFNLFSNFTRNHFYNRKYSFEDQLKMNRYEYTNWVEAENSQGNRRLYITDYKKRIMSL